MADDYAAIDDNLGTSETTDDEFYSLGANVTDDYWRFKNNYATNTYDDDDNDDRYFSTKHTTSWLDNLLSNTTASQEGSLSPVEDVNPDNVLATLVFNSIVCVMLLGLYELLRRWIPSVYSQRLMHEGQGYNSRGEGCCANGGCGVCRTCMEGQFARISGMKASGQSLRQMRVEGSVMNGKSEEEGKEEVDNGDIDKTRDNSCLNVQKGEDENSLSNNNNSNNIQEGETCIEELSSRKTTCCKKTCSLPIFEWCIPVHATPWSTFRRLAGLDAYFYLRYIRMCLKITAVSSFWAIVILCPVYATGGGDQTGFYHFSMANVLQEDKGRVWVPTFFCWAFTAYTGFCIKEEMMHYLELRAEFLGGEEEEGILRRRETMLESRPQGGYGPPEENVISNGNAAENSVGNATPLQDEGLGDGVSEKRSRSRSPLLANEEGDSSAVPPIIPPVQPSTSQQIISKQHRYSLQVEKVPVALRSNTALFNYFNEMFPNQVHSACIAINAPDLDALSARRQRVCRRLEKSLAYYSVTGIRPTHIAGRPRCQCCGIESTPIDRWCIAGCCFYDTCKMQTYLDEDDENYPTEVYESLPEKGECVDSILYYTCDLALSNLRMKKLQEEKFRIAETGNAPRRRTSGVGCGGVLGDVDIDESNCDWYAQPLGMLKTSAAMAAEGLREEFEVSGEEDYLGDGVTTNVPRYGAVSCTSPSNERTTAMPSTRQQSIEKRTRLIDEDHLVDSDSKVTAADSPSVSLDGVETDGVPSGETSPRSKSRYHRPYTWLRALLWRMGVDFLAAGLDEVRNRTDVVVDSVTRPSMSSTGFVTFKTLTPVTVTTSAPLTYNRNPMEVSIAAEPRNLVWKNVQIDRDIGASRAFVANVLLGLGVLLWSIPLTLIQAWAKVENVALIPGLEWVDQIHGGSYKALINGYLPVITLLGLILILPLIFQWVATSYEKRKTLSGVQNSIVGRYFYYQLANIYITVTAGALWTSLAEIIDHPQKLLVILGETFPKLAGYFISLLLTKTFAGLPMVLLRMGALSRMMFLRSCFNKKRLTQRELKEVFRKQPIFYGWEYPTQFLVIIICFTYACITPFVLPVGAVYYFMALLVYKKQALYVYTPTYESGGRMFPQAVSKTLFALLISQMTFIGYTLIRKGVFQIILLSPLPFLTVFFTLFIERRYVEPSQKLSLERAVKIDALSDQSPNFSDEAYQQPVLTEKASVPACETSDDFFSEVIENLDRLQKCPSQLPNIV